MLMPKTMLRYGGTTGRTTAVVLKDSSILEVKRDGIPTKTHFKTYADWLATLPEGAETALKVDTNPAGTKPIPAASAAAVAPITDADWMLLAVKPRYVTLDYSLNDWVTIHKAGMDRATDQTWMEFSTVRYNNAKQRVDAAGGPESNAATHRAPRFRGRPLWILSAEGKPEALFFGHTVQSNVGSSAVVRSDVPYFFYKGNKGTTFAEVGIPVDAETGWPNLWRLHANQFKPVRKPVV